MLINCPKLEKLNPPIQTAIALIIFVAGIKFILVHDNIWLTQHA